MDNTNNSLVILCFKFNGRTLFRSPLVVVETPLQKVIMTEGRGYSWTDSEVKALLVIWAKDKIQQKLEGAKRNEVVFKNISSKWLEFGI